MMKAHLTQAALSIDVTLDSLKEQVAEVLTPRLGWTYLLSIRERR